MCARHHMKVESIRGIRPRFNRILLKIALYGTVNGDFGFRLVRHTVLSHIGWARKRAS